MAKFNCAWLIHTQQFRSLTGIEPYTFLELRKYEPSPMRGFTQVRMVLC